MTPRKATGLGGPPRPPRFTVEDANAAHRAWGANCGPGALAAIAGLTLDEVRPHLAGFNRKRYTNPRMMFRALDSIGLAWAPIAFDEDEDQASGQCRRLWPDWGLIRVQWHGPWTQPDAPPDARKRHSHWIGCSRTPGRSPVGVFDINCIGNGTGWVDLHLWTDTVVPWLLEQCEPDASGFWSVTHILEVRRP